MIRSMTGYGSATAGRDGGSVTVEARSVNSRHLKISLRLPEGGESWEPELRELVGAEVRRGHVELRVRVDAGEAGAARWELDEPRVRAHLAALESLRRNFGIPGQVDLALLVRVGGILREAQDPGLTGLPSETVREGAAEALSALVEMREREGARLEEDLRERIAAIRGGADLVTRLAPERLRRERDRLRAAVAELADGLVLDEERLAREVAVLADRWDVGEELVRARAHLDAFEEYLEAPAIEPVGKRLSFLVQELHREVNTIGAKANDAEISRTVVEMKNEVERLREQVENVE